MSGVRIVSPAFSDRRLFLTEDTVTHRSHNPASQRGWWWWKQTQSCDPTRSLKHQIALFRAPSGAGFADTSQGQHRQSRLLVGSPPPLARPARSQFRLKVFNVGTDPKTGSMDPPRDIVPRTSRTHGRSGISPPPCVTNERIFRSLVDLGCIREKVQSLGRRLLPLVCDTYHAKLRC